MTFFILILSGLVLIGFAVVLMARTVFSVHIENTRLRIALGMIGCGVRYESRENRISLFVGSWSPLSKTLTAKPEKKEGKKPPRSKKAKPKTKPGRKLPFPVILKVVKAGLLFVGRILSRVQYDDGQLDLQPVMTNPALAGMAYGWSRAMKGIFPGLPGNLNFAPQYCFGSGRITARAEFSIKNQQIMVVLWRLLCDLPIIELIKYRFSKKR